MKSCKDEWRFRLWFRFYEQIRMITYTTPSARNASIQEICGKTLKEVEKEIEEKLDLMCPPEN